MIITAIVKQNYICANLARFHWPIHLLRILAQTLNDETFVTGY